MQRFFGIAQDVNGNAIPSCTVRVRLAGTATDATLFSDNSYTPQVNPFTSETDGAYQFYARDGRYDVILTKTGFTFDDDDTADVELADGQSVISPSQITADQNNYNPTNAANATIWRLNTDAARVITGIVAPVITSGTYGWSIRIVNVGSNLILLSNQDSGSSAANQIITGTGTYLTIPADESVNLTYDNVSTRWRVITERGARSSFTLDKVTTDGSTTTGNATATIYSFSLPGRALNTNSVVKATCFVEFAHASAAQDGQFRITYGGTTIAAVGAGLLAGAGGSFAIAEGWIQGDGSSTAQFGSIKATGDSLASAGTRIPAWVDVGAITAVDSASAQTLAIEYQFTAATSTATVKPLNAYLEWIR